MDNLPDLLSPIELSLDQLLLDPNNPRFSELGEVLNSIPEGRFADEKVQANTYEKMRDPMFDVAELRDTIKAIGFLPMDRVVVREWKVKTEPTRYVVIEGNRRVTALKWLVGLHEIGKETFDEGRIKNYTQLECLLLNDDLASPSASLILPGLRHVSGIKEWGPYQKAKAVHALRSGGLSPQEAAQSLGLSTRAANSSYRCFVALEQMVADEEFGEFAEPKMYSYFEEVFKRPVVRGWLNWSDEKERFCDQQRLHEFYSWMLPHGEDGTESPKLPEAKAVRDLSEILEDESALNVLRSPEGTLTRALARYQVDHPEDWYPKVLAAEAALKSLTPDMLRNMDEATVVSLQDLGQRITQALSDRDKLATE
ncbi:MAG: ParB-like nuclease domain-containing protein [Proteobacteria bacterium]|nr:ParB-like nuclease domain-containing protein [Pseudomonadota bacterium]